MAYLTRRRVLGAEIEVTPGTAETLAQADTDYDVQNPTLTPNIPMTEINAQRYMTNLTLVPEGYAATCTFRTTLRGDGAAGIPPWASVFLPAAGFTASAQVYTPKTEAVGTNVKTLTVGLFEHGRYKSMRGAVVEKLEITGTSGKVVFLDWTLQGVWNGVTDTAEIASATVPGSPMRLASTTFTIGGAAPACVEMFKLSIQNQVVLLPCPDTAAGFKYGLIGGRKIICSVNPEAVLVATKDHYGLWLSRTQEALSMAIQDSTDKVTFAAPKMQRINIGNEDRGGVIVDAIDFECCQSSGDDELSITFSAP